MQFQVLEELSCTGHWSQKTLVSVPPIVWSKLQKKLHPLLQFRIGVGGALVLRWAHRQVEEVAAVQYLGLHHVKGGFKAFSMLAEYFSGRLAQERNKEQSALNRARQL